MDVYYVRLDQLFEWDSEKARLNVVKHRVTFEQATAVFFDQRAIAGVDEEDGEARDTLLGLSADLSTLFVVSTERGESIRIISARRATAFEVRVYERNRNGWSRV